MLQDSLLEQLLLWLLPLAIYIVKLNLQSTVGIKILKKGLSLSTVCIFCAGSVYFLYIN